MKKLFFSAVFLIAFSSVSMAETKDVKVSKNKVVIVLVTDCLAEAAYKMEQYEAAYGCLSSSQYNHKFLQFFNACQNKSLSAN